MLEENCSACGYQVDGSGTGTEAGIHSLMAGDLATVVPRRAALRLFIDSQPWDYQTGRKS